MYMCICVTVLVNSEQKLYYELESANILNLFIHLLGLGFKSPWEDHRCGVWWGTISHHKWQLHMVEAFYFELFLFPLFLVYRLECHKRPKHHPDFMDLVC